MDAIPANDHIRDPNTIFLNGSRKLKVEQQIIIIIKKFIHSRHTYSKAIDFQND